MLLYLGSVGNNFAAGMTGGMAFVYDKDGNFTSKNKFRRCYSINNK